MPWLTSIILCFIQLLRWFNSGKNGLVNKLETISKASDHLWEGYATRAINISCGNNPVVLLGISLIDKSVNGNASIQFICLD